MSGADHPEVSVVYHGSHARYHGLATRVGECGCNTCRATRGRTTDIRWSLVTAEHEQLDHVHPESYTRATHPDAAQRLAESIVLHTAIAAGGVREDGVWQAADDTTREAALIEARNALDTLED